VPINFQVSPDVCDAIITDEEWLWQMLLNLLTNACKYTDKGSIQVKIRVTTDISLPDSEKGLTMSPSSAARSAKNEALLFEVIDTGAWST
jgi:signal transduction histidine kinase